MVVVVVVVCPEKPPRGWGASWTREKHGTMVTVVDGVLIFFFHPGNWEHQRTSRGFL